MRRRALRTALLLLACLPLVACERARVQEGAALYGAHCASCHGERGQGQEPARPYGGIDPDHGILAPALNAEGHCWSHTTAELVRIVKQGGTVDDSPMPAWGEVLSDTQIRALIDYLRSLWPHAIRRQQRQLG